ncbi:MAG: hypothetical protein KIT09_09820 [Bryobacteraceae bacterium]|nr:hypothetical protein [Bryobacteraceae bacterium]
MMKEILALTSIGLSAALLAAQPPTAEIANDQLHVRIYLPDAKNGYYRGTRFDWSGVVYSLVFNGHDYYGPWFNKTDPNVRDFIYDGPDIVAGPCSAITGPVDEFRPVGWDDAAPGAAFVKIGVGALRKPDDAKYDNYRLYEIADGGKWTIDRKRDSIAFTQELPATASGYGYSYRKTIRLDKSEMVLEHALKNTGKRAIQTTVYNHNFLVLDRQPTGPDFTIAVPFPIRSSRPPAKELAEIRGNRIVYLKTLTGRDVVTTPVEGFGDSAKDHEIRIENTKLGVGMLIRADRPLVRESLWSIRTVIAMEPFIAIDIAPGAEFTWTASYHHYAVPSKPR